MLLADFRRKYRKVSENRQESQWYAASSLV